MKKVIRLGVFETNSSSTHSLMMMPKEALETDENGKPAKRKCGVITSKFDKLLMACGCCYEIFADERTHLQYNCTEEEDQKNYFALKNHEKIYEDITLEDYIASPYCNCRQVGEDLFERTYDQRDFSYEVAIDYVVGVYCKLTGEDYDAVSKDILRRNKSGRACHMKFFEEGALYDADWDYRLICELFTGTIDDIECSVAAYFNDNYALCYREFYGGVNFDDDED